MLLGERRDCGNGKGEGGQGGWDGAVRHEAGQGLRACSQRLHMPRKESLYSDDIGEPLESFNQKRGLALTGLAQ